MGNDANVTGGKELNVPIFNHSSNLLSSLRRVQVAGMPGRFVRIRFRFLPMVFFAYRKKVIDEGCPILAGHISAQKDIGGMGKWQPGRSKGIVKVDGVLENLETKIGEFALELTPLEIIGSGRVTRVF